jgi:squalene-associated FAD-dependent desaturase
MSSNAPRKTVAIVGGGLAGLAAGCALVDVGFDITVYERRPYLGGRASSYEHPGTGEVVDNCQHVLLGCCTNLVDLYRRIGVQNQIRWYDALTFVEPGGRRSEIAIGSLPAPLHTAPSFLRAKLLSLKDKLAITRAMLALTPRLPQDDGRSFLDWLKEHGQTERAIDRFWKVVLVSALNEDLDRVSVSSAALVFRESFLKSPQAGRMGVPTVPLTELYSKAGEYITAHGGRVELRANVESIQASVFRKYDSGAGTTPNAVPNVGGHAGPPFDPAVKLCISGIEVLPDCAILAVPFDVLQRVLPDNSPAGPLHEKLTHFETSPITGVHLWFDREVSELEHAVLLDRTIQWMFHKSRIQNRETALGSPLPAGSVHDTVPSAPNSQLETRSSGSYVELVISASKSLVDKSRTEIIDLAVRELAEFFPAVRDAKLLKATVIKEVHATYAPVPGIDQSRPHPQTPWPQVFLAGDWTATGWPATMESAVRSGYLAAEALCRAAGVERTFLAPDLPPSGLMRFFR